MVGIINVPKLPWRRLPTLLPSSSRKIKKKPYFPRKQIIIRFILILLLFIALIPPIFLHLRLRRFNQMRMKRCRWVESPPLVCAHGGDSSRAVPNTMEAFRAAIESQVDCIEIDVTRSSDGQLFALHDRDLQRMSGNTTATVGFMTTKEIEELDAAAALNLSTTTPQYHNQKVAVATIQDALTLVSSSVRQVILDAKVGPPLYEKGLAHDLLSVVKRTNCNNCIIWSKSDILGRDVIELTHDIPVGYIVMKDFSTGATSRLFRIQDAEVVGAYHPLIDERFVRILRRKGTKVYAWTVDDADSMRRLLSEHVDAIVTGYPSLLQGTMEDMRRECLEEGSTSP